jgi:transcriptional regulator with XRE-family HTH domain
MNANYTLRALRESLDLTMEEVAEEAKVSFRTVLRAEQGYPLNPGSRRRLSKFYGKSSEELGLVPQRQRKRSVTSQQGQSEQKSSSLGTLQSTAQGMLVAIQNLENEGVDMNRSRRFFLQMLGVAGVAIVASPKEILHPAIESGHSQTTDASISTIENLASMTHHYRSLQRAGFATEDGLRTHIGLIQNALENTVSDRYRRELWRIQAQSQLLARHSITSKRELGRARTWNEFAIASAQYSGDAILLGAALGHLGHLSLTRQGDPVLARHYISQAQEHTKGDPISGWFAMVIAAIAAAEKNKEECEASVAQATEVVHGLPQTPDCADLYYTDFNVEGVDAFAGNCLLKVGEPKKGLERLSSINLSALSENRHASAFYDIACAYAVLGELEATQAYAFRSIDKALTTDRVYIIPRFIILARGIQKKDPHESHAASIIDYAQTALYENSKGGLE